MKKSNLFSLSLVTVFSITVVVAVILFTQIGLKSGEAAQSPIGQAVTNDCTYTMVSPDGGENWTVGTNQGIRWYQWVYPNIVCGSNVKLEYSIDGGSTWKMIDDSNIFSDSGYYSWTVPDDLTTQGRVKVTDTSNSTYNDTSDADFTIAASSCAQLPSAPTGLTAVTMDSYFGGLSLSWSAVSVPVNCNISSYKIYRNGSYIVSVSSGIDYSVTYYIDGSIQCDGITSYTYQVSAVDQAGEGPLSSSSSPTVCNVPWYCFQPLDFSSPDYHEFCGDNRNNYPPANGSSGGCQLSSGPTTAVELANVGLTYLLYAIFMSPLAFYRQWLRRRRK